MKLTEVRKEIIKLQKQHDLIMKKFYKTQTEINRWGDSDLYQRADCISQNKQLLIDALELINKYQKQKISH